MIRLLATNEISYTINDVALQFTGLATPLAAGFAWLRSRFDDSRRSAEPLETIIWGLIAAGLVTAYSIWSGFTFSIPVQ